MAEGAGGERSASPPLETPHTNNETHLTKKQQQAKADLESAKDNTRKTTEQHDTEQSTEAEEGDSRSNVTKATQPKVTSATCIPKAAESIKIELPSHIINEEIQFMQDHALIGKFLGFWPTERALNGWIASKWKPKGQVTLQLGPKGFFTAIFNCIEDKTRIFEGGPYFFNSSGLYLTDWKPRFSPDKEDFSWAPVWIRMYSLPVEYWRDETLEWIGNKLGTFIKIATETKTRKFTSYARICVQMHLTKTLAASVSLFHDDYEWKQPIDYEHIPFRCRKCHKHGHLFRDCPLNGQPKSPPTENPTDPEGFTKITNRRRHARKHQVNPPPPHPSKAHPSNRFTALESLNPHSNLEDVSLDSLHPSPPSHKPANPPSSSALAPSKITNPPYDKKVASASDMDIQYSSKGKSVLNDSLQASDMDLDAALALSLHEEALEDTTLDKSAPDNMEEDRDDVALEEFNISKLDISKLETACQQKDYALIPLWQIDKIEGVLTRVQHHKSLGIQGGSQWDGRKIHKDTKKRGRKTDLQRTIELGEILMNSGQFPKLTKFFKPTEPSP